MTAMWEAYIQPLGTNFFLLDLFIFSTEFFRISQSCTRSSFYDVVEKKFLGHIGRGLIAEQNGH